MLASEELRVRPDLSFRIRPPRPGEWPKTAADAALLATDPDGALVAAAEDGRILGRAAAAVREDALLLARLEVEPAARRGGVGRALLEAVRAYGAARRARALEALAPSGAEGVAFLLGAGLSLRTLVLTFAGAPPKSAAGAGALEPVGFGAALSGWVADLDRETRGFARVPEWERAVAAGEVLALRRRGRPEAVGALRRAGTRAWIGPAAGRSPEAAAQLLVALAARAGASGASRLVVRVPAEAAALLSAARSLSLVAGEAIPLLALRRRGDFRRIAGSPGIMF
jgi:GNAT superfamily N-acetyltransferase